VKLYVAGPMTGYNEYNYRQFSYAADRLEYYGYEVLNPCDNDKILKKSIAIPTWQDYMKASIKQVLEAEGMAVLAEWGLSRGARLEVNIAHSLQIPVLPVDVWIHQAKTEKAS